MSGMFICRACLTFEENLFPIKEYKYDFVECVGVEVNDHDLLCPTCMRKLNEAKAFRCLARKSARILQLKQDMKIVEVKEEAQDIEVVEEEQSEFFEERLEFEEGEALDEENEEILLEEKLIIEEVEDDEYEEELEVEEISRQHYKDEVSDPSDQEPEEYDDENYMETLVDQNESFDLIDTKKKSKIIDKERSKEYARRGKLAWSQDVRAHLIRNCPYCFYEHSNKRVMMEHVQNHIIEAGGLECDHCGRRFFKKQRMKEHLMRTLYGSKKASEQRRTGFLQCCFCPENFTNFEEYESHVVNQHPDKQQTMDAASLVCDLCGDTFPKRYLLNNHIRIVHKPSTGYRIVKPKATFQCSYCPKTYLSRRSQLQHEMNHTGVKPYICSICSRAFKSAKALKSHEFVHSDEKNFECETCGKRYRTKDLLRGHEIIHSTNFKYTCEVCGIKFKRSCHLKEHLMTHSDRRDYSCGVCGTAYKAKNTLRRHLKHHAQKLGVDENCYLIEEKDGVGIGNIVLQ